GKKTRATRFIRQKPRMNYFKRDLTAQVCVERFVSHAHGAPAELDRSACLIGNQLILVEAMYSASIVEIFVAQRYAQQTADAAAFGVVGPAQSRTALRPDRLSCRPFNALCLVHEPCAKALQR